VSNRAVHVAAAVLIDRRGRVLIAQRPPGKHLGGAWEFPGGKVEPGETPREGLARELEEEIGVSIEHPRPLIRLRHTYPTREVLLDVWVVRRYRGQPRGLDGQALRWCDGKALRSAQLLPADRPIVSALRLPQRLCRAYTRWYSVCAFKAFLTAGAAQIAGGRGGTGRLEGVLCRGVGEAEEAAAAGAHFLALSTPVAPARLAALCERVSVPVFVRGLALESAWAQGASGINALVAS
jgi:mutator protein MutT